ncbi:MAG TPA: PH domain-containing protein [Planctomycetota bacterium]|nr:PH domain-containing protein [Planctomycetota bacterium]
MSYPIRGDWYEAIHEERIVRATVHLVFIIAGGTYFALLSLMNPLRIRYEIRPSELVVRSGLLWRSTIRIPISEITHVDQSSGPLMRTFGLEDLHVYARTGSEKASATLLGLRSTEEVGRLLDERREYVQGSYHP